MKRVLSIDEEWTKDGGIELSDDRESCRSFWATLLDYASSQRAEEVGYRPIDGDNCITIVVGGRTYPMEPIPREVRQMYLRYAQDLVLGRMWYTILILLRKRPFVREQCEPLFVEAGSRRSKWEVRCTHESIHFRRL
jgi:hypothetical protein